jgi:hypothetical protein
MDKETQLRSTGKKDVSNLTVDYGSRNMPI